jgi:hypothetical protein
MCGFFRRTVISVNIEIHSVVELFRGIGQSRHAMQ